MMTLTLLFPNVIPTPQDQAPDVGQPCLIVIYKISSTMWNRLSVNVQLCLGISKNESRAKLVNNYQLAGSSSYLLRFPFSFTFYPETNDERC